MNDEWDRVAELWIRQQRAEGPDPEATRKEQQYYKLLEQLLGAQSELQAFTELEVPNRYQIELELLRQGE